MAKSKEDFVTVRARLGFGFAGSFVTVRFAILDIIATHNPVCA